MSIKSKKEVLKNIREVKKTAGGKVYTAYEVYFGTDHTGAKLRKSKATREAAKACVDEFFAQVKAHGEFPMGVLTRRELYDAREALDTLSEAGMSETLYEVARHFVEGAAKGGVHAKALGEAYEEYFAEIPDIQKLHKRAVNGRVRKWVTAFGPDRPCTAVTSREVAAYLTQFDVPKTFNNMLGYIRTFLGWCAKSQRQYLASNPLTDMALAQVAYREPEYMRADDVAKMMQAVEEGPDAGRLACHAALSFFCGVRQEEIKRLADHPDDVQLEERMLRISMPKGWTKGAIPRVVQLPDNALAWLTKYDVRKHLAKATPWTVDKLQCVARGVGVAFPANAGRHTFITMHVAAYGDPSKTEAMVGTSATMRSKHYQGLASKIEGERYFAILPT
jgi:integrase